MKTLNFFTGALVVLFVLGCGKSSNPTSPSTPPANTGGGGNTGGTGGGDTGGGGTLPPPPPPPPPSLPSPWFLPEGYQGRNVLVDNLHVYVSGVRDRVIPQNAFFFAMFNKNTGQIDWVDSVKTPAVYNWVTKGIGILGGEVFAVRWEDPQGGGNAKVFANKYSQTGPIIISPWPFLLGEHTAGMDLIASNGMGMVFASTIRTVTALGSTGVSFWRSSFGFDTNQNVGALAANQSRLFMVGTTNSGLWGVSKTGVLDAYIAEVNPANGSLIKGSLWFDRSYPESDLKNKYTFGDAIGIAPDGIVIAALTGLDANAVTPPKSKVIKVNMNLDPIPLWMFSTENEKKIYGFLVDSEGNSYALSSSLWKIGLGGNQIWTAAISAHEGGGIALDVTTNNLFVVSDSRKVYRISASSGAILN